MPLVTSMNPPSEPSLTASFLFIAEVTVTNHSPALLQQAHQITEQGILQ
jgi:hypothetical protein